MIVERNAARGAVFLALLCFLASGTLAQEFPDRPIRFIAGYPPGSQSDTVARLLGQGLTQLWGQQVIVDNRPGAAGNIAAEITARAQPDGYTMLLVATNHTIVSSLYRKLSFDPVRDFEPVALVSTTPTILIVNPSLPVKSVADFIAFARAKPGELSYGSSGTGASPHLVMELFKTIGGLDIVHVPYKGIPQALVDLLAGRIHTMFSTVAPAMPYVRSGKVRALGVSTAGRSRAAPDVPAISESLPGFDAASWQGVLVPAATPKRIVQRLNAAIVRIVRTPEVNQRMVALGYNPVGSTPDELGAFIRSETTKWSKVAKASGARLD
ncbi:MAG: tripartite tricarboxylate transporter substrate binding protein [Burkholderiales bacterium]|nr:tripartite tricarboxylate transporter substrate binding protein [Burkholderiales bacterium]